MLLTFACLTVCLGLCLPLFQHYRPINRPLGAAFKSIGSLCAVILAAIAALKLDESAWVCFAALLTCAAADWLLDMFFPVGLGFFGAAHLILITWYLHLCAFTLAHILCILFAMGIVAFLLYRWKKEIGKHIMPFALYGCVLSIMTGCGIAGGLMSYTPAGWLTAAGAVLFFISDGMVTRNLLFHESRSFSIAFMIIYYTALHLIGGACLFI